MSFKHYEQTRAKLDKIGPGFCLAKWTSLTLHLESGLTHSCHHPKAHKVPLEELEKNPGALHNTAEKISYRKEMLEGQKPQECDYCWNIENLNTNAISDRILKSSYSWSLPFLDRIIADPLTTLYKPSYLEVSFSNVCQMKCSYCSANFSTKWEEDIRKDGPYPTQSGSKTSYIYKEENNPYITAFWKWWPQIKDTLHTFRITGGEPLLSKNTFGVLESLLENPQPDLNLIINSNLCVPSPLVEKLIVLADELVTKKKVKKLDIYTSIDAFGEKAEYIRHGFKHDLFWKHVEEVLTRLPESQIIFMSTFNALSLTSYIELMEKVRHYNLVYRNPIRQLPIDLDISYLRNPNYQTVQVLSEDYLKPMGRIVQYLEDHQWQNFSNNVGFHDHQLLKAKRIYEWMQESLDSKSKLDRQKDFYEFFSQHDLRRGTNFLKTFPEMESFWNECRKHSETFNSLKKDHKNKVISAF